MSDLDDSRRLRLHRAYYSGFLVVLVLCFTPLKILSYALPALFTAWLVVNVRGVVSRNRLLAMGAVLGLLAVVYDLVGDEFHYFNFFLAIITYSSFLPIILLDGKALADKKLLEKLLVASAVMIGIQGCVGLVQAVYGFSQTGSFGFGNGDYVMGTIQPQLGPDATFSNPMFAANMAVMLLGCLALPHAFEGPRRIYLALGMTAFVLASVIHVLLFLAASVFLSFLLTRPRTSDRRDRRRQRRLVRLLILGGCLVYVALPSDVEHVAQIAEQVTDLQALNVPRAIMLYRVLIELPEDAPQQPYVGLGPGQFSSRASLIASGLYLGGANTPKALPFGSPESTRLAADYCLSLLVTFADQTETFGSSQQPFFSILSIYTELGLVGLAVLLWIGARMIRRAQQQTRTHPHLRFQALLFCSGVLFIGFLGFQENYWEMPQAIFVGLLLLKVMHANLMHGTES